MVDKKYVLILLFILFFSGARASEGKYIFAAQSSGSKLVSVDFGWTISPLIKESPKNLLILDKSGFSKGTFVRNEEKCQVLCAQADDPVCHIEAIYKVSKPLGKNLMGVLDEGEVSGFKSIKAEAIPVSGWLKSVNLSEFSPSDAHMGEPFFLSIAKNKKGRSQLLKKESLERGEAVEVEKDIEKNCRALRVSELTVLRCKQEFLILDGNRIAFAAPFDLGPSKFEPMATFVRNKMIHYVFHWSDDEGRSWTTVLAKMPSGWKYIYAGGGYPTVC